MKCYFYACLAKPFSSIIDNFEVTKNNQKQSEGQFGAECSSIGNKILVYPSKIFKIFGFHKMINFLMPQLTIQTKRENRSIFDSNVNQKVFNLSDVSRKLRPLAVLARSKSMRSCSLTTRSELPISDWCFITLIDFMPPVFLRWESCLQWRSVVRVVINALNLLFGGLDEWAYSEEEHPRILTYLMSFIPSKEGVEAVLSATNQLKCWSRLQVHVPNAKRMRPTRSQLQP